MRRTAIAIATGVFSMTSTAEAAPTRPPIEHYGRPMLNGQPLPFSDAVRVGDTLYLSGQLGIGADGKLPEGIEAQTKQALDNIGAILKRVVLRYDPMTDRDSVAGSSLAKFALLGHCAGEACLVTLYHCRAMIDVLTADGVLDVVAAGVDRLPDLHLLVDVRPRGLIEL